MPLTRTSADVGGVCIGNHHAQRAEPTSASAATAASMDGDWTTNACPNADVLSNRATSTRRSSSRRPVSTTLTTTRTGRVTQTEAEGHGRGRQLTTTRTNGNGPQRRCHCEK